MGEEMMREKVEKTMGETTGRGGQLLRLLPVFVALGLCACAESPSSRRSSAVRLADESPMIINGQRVSAKDAEKDKIAKSIVDSTVALEIYENGQAVGICTGTLIFPDIVLTAAHCIDGNTDRVVAVFATEVEGAASERAREVVKWEQHPDWGKGVATGRADLALVKLERDAPPDTRPAKFLLTPLRLKEHDEFVIAGYGLSIAYIRESQGVLRRAKTTIIGVMSLTEIVSDGSGSSVCFGDSGGPAYIERGGELYLWGVASAVSSRLCNEMSAHTDILLHLGWIARTAADLRGQAGL